MGRLIFFHALFFLARGVFLRDAFSTQNYGWYTLVGQRVSLDRGFVK
jgi:hypothetical protein